MHTTECPEPNAIMPVRSGVLLRRNVTTMEKVKGVFANAIATFIRKTWVIIYALVAIIRAYAHGT